MICDASSVCARPTAWPSSCRAKVYQEFAPVVGATTRLLNAMTPDVMWKAPASSRDQVLCVMPTRFRGWPASRADAVRGLAGERAGLGGLAPADEQRPSGGGGDVAAGRRGCRGSVVREGEAG